MRYSTPRPEDPISATTILLTLAACLDPSGQFGAPDLPETDLVVGDSSAHTGDSAGPDTGDSAEIDTGDSAVDTGETKVDTGDSAVDSAFDTGDSAEPDTGDSAIDTGDTAEPDTGDSAIDTGQADVETGDSAVDSAIDADDSAEPDTGDSAEADTATGPDVDEDGITTEDGDCDDTRDDIYPGAPEYCDGVDHDCDGLTDEPDSVDALTQWPDSDGDGWGHWEPESNACTIESGYSATMGDCDDSDAAASPDAAEWCYNGIDDDCDGLTDTGPSDNLADAMYSWNLDADGDGYGNLVVDTHTCENVPPTGYVNDNGDCDDADPNVNPAAGEYCDDSVDNDCDGDTDEATDAVDGYTYYTDSDLDGYGTGNGTSSCTSPPYWLGYANRSGDCDDQNQTISPEAIETPRDGVDQDCDGADLCAAPVTFAGDVSFSGATATSDAEAFCAAYDAVDGNIEIYDVDWNDMTALACVCDIGGALLISEAESLVDLSGLESVQSIEGGVSIYSTTLTNVDGFESLMRVGGDLDFEACIALESLEGLASLTELDGSFILDAGIFWQDALPSLHGLEGLTTIGGNLELRGGVEYDDGIASVAGLENVTSIGGDVIIFDEDMLTDLDSLAALGMIGGSLLIEGNRRVEDLSGLQGVTSVGAELRITHNVSLPSAQAEALRDAIGVGNIGGTVTLSDNAP